MTTRIFQGTGIVQQVHHVIDGDTFVATIQNWPSLIGRKIRIRLARIDTPELNDPDPIERLQAQVAKDLLTNRLKAADKIHIVECRRCKYFRVIAEVYADGDNLSDYLLKNQVCWLSKPARPKQKIPGQIVQPASPHQPPQPSATVYAVETFKGMLVWGEPPDEVEWLVMRRTMKQALFLLEKRGKNLTNSPELGGGNGK